MEAVPTAQPRRRPRRGSADRPIDARLVRKASLVLVAPLLIVVLTISHVGPYPPAALPPSFDGESAASLTRELARDHPDRVAGSPGATAAAEWYREKLGLYGIPLEIDTWTEDVPGRGVVTLSNVAAIVRGTLDETIVVAAHRDSPPGTAGANDNASGTAVLVELARAYARFGSNTLQSRTPLHTIVFLSTDAGAYGDLGAARFARSARGAQTVAVIVLDGLAGDARPHLEIAGSGGTTAPISLVRTLRARLLEQGVNPVLPDPLEQLVWLGVPLALGGQAPLLDAGIPAVRVSSASELRAEPGDDEIAGISVGRLDRLGNAIDATLASLDNPVQLPRTTTGFIVGGERALRGTALQILLIAAVIPFAVGALDLLARCRRKGTRLDGAWRAYRRRAGFWLAGLVALAVATVVGVLPGPGRLAPRPDLPPVDTWPAAGLGLLVLLGIAVWFRERTLLAPVDTSSSEEELAGWAAALVALLGCATLVALANPYALTLLLPSLYAWLALVQIGRSRGWVADMLYGVGLIGPFLAIVVLAQQLHLGLRGPLYAAALLTSGTVPWLVSLALAGWVAAAAQIGALITGRYAPLTRSSSRR